MSEAAPIRVCYVVAYFHPLESGAERQAMAQGIELTRRGHVVHVVTHAANGLPSDENVRGIHVHRWVRSSRRGPLFALTFVAGVIRALRKLRGEYDVIHTHQALWEAVATGLGRSWLPEIPTLVQPASSGYYGEAEELMRTRGASVLRRTILRNTAFAAISADIERQWRALGVPSHRVHRTASGVDADVFKPGPSRYDATLLPRPRVLFTGRLHPQKNLGVLLDAWPQVVARTGANLILAGHGPDRDRLSARALELGVADHVQFTGSVSDPAELLRAADLFVLPSVAEGMSNSLLEAMAAALPCVASEIGGNTDLLGDGQSGRVVDANEPSAWARNLIEVLEDPEAARRMGQAARRRIEQEFALPVVVDRYVSLYRRLLDEARAGRPDQPVSR